MMHTLNKFIPKLMGWLAVGTAMVCLMPFQAMAKDDYTAVNIFGDSLVDSGNFSNLTGLPPSPPYATGKFSNGSLWVDMLAEEFSLAPALSTEIIAGTPLPTGGINFALGGSLTSMAHITAPQLPGLQQQVGAFSSLAPLLSPDADTLFVLATGGNDYNQIFINPDAVPTPLDRLANQVTDNMIDAALTLINAGAQNLLIANLPNLGQTPLAKQLNQLDAQNGSLLTSMTSQHNQLLDAKLTALSATSQAKITQLDLNGLFESIINTPNSFGFANALDSCLTNFQSGFAFEGVCDNPDEFVFWDDVHPTEAGHTAIAQFAIEALHPKEDIKSVPEPSNVLTLLMLGGGAAIAWSSSKRRKVEESVLIPVPVRHNGHR